MFPGNLEVHFSLPPLPPFQKREKKLVTHGTPPHTRCACNEHSFLAAPYQALLCRRQTRRFCPRHWFGALAAAFTQAYGEGNMRPCIRKRGRCLPASCILFGSSLSRWTPTGSWGQCNALLWFCELQEPNNSHKGTYNPAIHPGLQVLSRIVSSWIRAVL